MQSYPYIGVVLLTNIKVFRLCTINIYVTCNSCTNFRENIFDRKKVINFFQLDLRFDPLCTGGTSQVVTIGSLQRLQMEALIPAPADCEIRLIIKFLNAQCADRNSSAVLRLWLHAARRSAHLLQKFAWEMFNHDPPYSPDLAPSDFHLFLHLKKFLSGQRQRFQNDREAEMSVTVVPIQAEDLYDTGYKS